MVTKPWQHFRFITARSLLDMTKLKRCQDSADALVDGSTIDYPVLISHRWTARNDPDPDCSQLKAVRYFVRALLDSMLTLSGSSSLDQCCDVQLHGDLQAALLASQFTCRHMQLDHDSLLDGVGVWYDYTCLPQHPRTQEETGYFKECLKGLSEVFQHAPMLIIRLRDDDYEQRGWCLAELASGDLSAFTPLVLFTELLGKRWHQSEVLAPLERVVAEKLKHNTAPELVRNAKFAMDFISSWPISRDCDGAHGGSGPAADACTRSQCSAAFMQDCRLGMQCCRHFSFGVCCTNALCADAAEQKPQCTRIIPPVADVAFEIADWVQQELQIQYLNSSDDTRDDASGDNTSGVDLEQLVKQQLDTHGVRCTNGGDVMLVGLWMLCSATVAQPYWSEFFTECHRRIVGGSSLALASFSAEEGEPFEYQFAE